MSSELYRARRQRVLNRLGDGLLLLPTAPLVRRNGDVFHPFRPDSDFFYLTGLDEPEAILAAFRIDRRRHHAVLFVRGRDPVREVWDGERLGPRRARRRLGVDEAHPLDSVYTVLEPLIARHPRLFYRLGEDAERDHALRTIFERLRIQQHRGNPPAHPDLADPRPAVALERLVKDRAEIEALERAARVSAIGHLAAMKAARAGMKEYELQAEIEACFRRGGSKRNGYESIVASGANACVLHYVRNDRRMRSGDLVLVDAGAEVSGYTADITRTFPVSGTFSDAQAEIYRLVLRAQKAAIRAVRPGRSWRAPHDAAVRAIVSGLAQLGLLRGDRKKLAEREAHRPWFMHGTSHWLGADVHDAGGYEAAPGEPRKLKPGMVLTVEPGLYFSRRDRKVPERYRGIGVRIEDDVLVTRGGNRVLTEGVPKELRDVEAVCRSR